MDLDSVSKFVSSEAGKHVPELANPGLDRLQQAKQLYMASNGRLPSPPLPEPLRPSKQLQAFKQEFIVGIEDFLSRSRDSDAAQAFRSSSWDKLQAEANKAWAAYSNHQKRKRNWRRPFEVLDHAAEKVMTSCCIEFLLELVPDGEYSSLLSGGLTLAYNTALRKEKSREDILELFDSLSEQGKQTKANIKLYSHDTELHAKSEELYMAVLDCVGHSTEWLDSSSSFESFKAFFQQSKYGAKLEDAKANLDKKSKEFDDTVNMCFRRQVNDIHSSIEWMKEPILATYSLLAGFLKDFPALLAAELSEEARKSQPPVINLVQNPVVTMQPPIMPVTIPSWQLCQCLSVEYSHVAGRISQDAATVALSELDADITTAMHHILPPLQREKMGFLTTSDQFKAWLRNIESAFLVVHEGNTPHQGVLSTLSHLCGLMARTMRVPGMWTLAFFCGLHTAAGAKLQGGKGLIRAVALQLLSTIPNETFPTPIDPFVVAQQLAMGDLDMICSIFAMVLGHLPAGMVFVLVDGAHWNGTEARSTEMRAVMRFLYKVVEQLRVARRGLALKVLVTNPTERQRYAWEIPGDILHMERQVLAGGHKGLEKEMIAGTVARLSG
ncbi:hypothetical protein HD806DRAFT_53150 [Xylariaceae sp. AK1471]|nr:hypothetical protein HD806DRAFT_53150 [Xylariaceae sp. AK1471]